MTEQLKAAALLAIDDDIENDPPAREASDWAPEAGYGGDGSVAAMARRAALAADAVPTEREGWRWGLVEPTPRVMREVVAVAVTMLYDTHKDDVLSAFGLAELSEIVAITDPLRHQKVEAIYRRAWDLLAAAPQPASEPERYAVMEAIRRALNKLPRYSFWLGDPPSVRRVPDKYGAWIEWQAAHELFDAEVLDNLLQPASEPQPAKLPDFAAAVAQRKWDALKEEGWRMTRIEFERQGSTSTGSIDPWGAVTWKHQEREPQPAPVGVDASDAPWCECHACIETRELKDPFGLPLSITKMILCPECGNKRCPKANNHKNACTGSNEPGQPGSAYPVVRAEGGEA